MCHPVRCLLSPSLICFDMHLYALVYVYWWQGPYTPLHACQRIACCTLRLLQAQRNHRTGRCKLLLAHLPAQLLWRLNNKVCLCHALGFVTAAKQVVGVLMTMVSFRSTRTLEAMSQGDRINACTGMVLIA